MKRILLITVLFLSVFSLAQAQRDTGQRPSKAGGGNGPGMRDPAERVERQTQRLSEALSLNADQIAKVKAIYTKEPTDEPTGKMIRQILSGELKVPPLSLQYLFCADRGVHQVELEKLLSKGYVIVTDRYFWSAVAYGISDLDGKPDYYMAAFSILSMYNQFLSPDYTFYLDVSVDEAYKRIKKSAKHGEIYDKKDKLVKIQKGYEVLVKKYPSEFTRVDGEKSVDELLSNLVKRVSRKLK